MNPPNDLHNLPSPPEIKSMREQPEVIPGQNVLLVEDDAITACYMQEVLGECCQCHFAYTLDEALRAFNEHYFSLILTDMHLLGGVLDGYAVLEAARRSRWNRHTPVAAVTGLNVPRSNFIQAGFDDLLYKPYTPVELLELVRRLTGHQA